jgi:hypothetical protein
MTMESKRNKGFPDDQFYFCTFVSLTIDLKFEER